MHTILAVEGHPPLLVVLAISTDLHCGRHEYGLAEICLKGDLSRLVLGGFRRQDATETHTVLYGFLKAEKTSSPSVQVDRIEISVEISPTPTSVSLNLDFEAVLTCNVLLFPLGVLLAGLSLLVEEEPRCSRIPNFFLSLEDCGDEVNFRATRMRPPLTNTYHFPYLRRHFQFLLLLDAGSHMHSTHREEWELGVCHNFEDHLCSHCFEVQQRNVVGLRVNRFGLVLV